MLCIEPARILCIVPNARDQQRAWIGAILSSTGWTLTDLARRAGVHQTTLTRWWNDQVGKATLSARTVSQIEAATAVPLSGGLDPARLPGPSALGDGEKLPATELLRDDIEAAVRGMIAGRNNIFPWRVKTRALEAVGFLPGDILVIDQSAIPEPGDAVCAQVYDFQGGRAEGLPHRAETVLRLYEPPHLVAATAQPGLRRPYYVDNRTVAIVGVVVGMFRPRLVA
ncbi:MAG: helix-turn-helix domain-containing protein [Rhodovulum sp.]|nr:helix-turn-helix domain-containing protein [Rhodovulum sp.]